MEYNRVKKRLLFLPPSVLSGKERECRVDDFVSLTRKAIGEGAFGEVYKVRHKTSGNLFAIKVINKERILKSNLLEQIKREVRIMYNLSHPHIIKLFNHSYLDEEAAGRLPCSATKKVKACREEEETRLRTKTRDELSEAMCQSLQKAVVGKLETVKFAPAFRAAERQEGTEGLGSAMGLQLEAAKELSKLLD